MFSKFTISFLFFTFYSAFGQSVLYMNNYSRALDKIFENSDPRVRPNVGGPPVEVGLTMYILSIPAIDHENSRFTAQFYFRQYWKDERLSFSGKDPVNLNYAGEIWQPDTFIANEQRALFHTVTVPNVFVRISPNGDVLKSERITVTASCPMNFRYFPLDYQICSLELESYGYTMKDVNYNWARNSGSVGVSPDGINSEFTLAGVRSRKTNTHLSSGNYSRLTVDIKFVRNYQFHIFNVYIPALLVFSLAWFTLWMNQKTIQTRLTLSITALALKVVLLVAARIYSPATSYLNSLEIYLGISFLSILGIVIHHAIITHATAEQDEEKYLDASGEKKKPFSIMSLEKYIRIALLVLYLIFNILYWIILVSSPRNIDGFTPQ